MRTVGATELRDVGSGTPDYRRLIDLWADAYPVMGLSTPEAREARFERDRGLEEREPEHRAVGAYRGGTLVGGMRLYDFSLCIRDAEGFAGGVGSVAVSLEHKRRGIARDLITGFLREYRDRGAALATLHPFRPDFYRAMGFGYGPKLNQYHLRLASLPRSGAREFVRRLDAGDADALTATYNRLQTHTNGMIRKYRWMAAKELANPDRRIFGFEERGTLLGYLSLESGWGPMRRKIATSSSYTNLCTKRLPHSRRCSHFCAVRAINTTASC